MAIAFKGIHPGVTVNYTVIPMTNGEYQTKVKAAAGTADSPDVVALEAAFVKEWVESDLLADLNSLVPLTKTLKTYPAVVEVGTDGGVASIVTPFDEPVGPASPALLTARAVKK